MEQPRRTAWIAACALSLAAAVAHADPQTPNFYGKKEKACRVHVAQSALTNVPSTIAGKSWHDICNVANYPSLFSPSVQYPGVPACGSGPWPRCSTTPGPEPDFGYRYPLVANVVATTTHQNPEVDWWSVCVRFDLTQIYSEPGVQNCGTGTTRQEIGRCVASAAYYENLNANATKHPAEFFYDFVFTHPDCEPCGHDVLSVVDACKRTCEHYFTRMGFDQDGTNPSDGGFGIWRDEDDPVWATRPPGKQFADVALRDHVYDNATIYDGRTPLEACKDFCGPPSTDCTPSSPGCVPAAHEAPPWVSQNEIAQRPPEEKADQWHWTIYERGRNPNENLSGTIRSYAVNIDHSSPTVECNGPIISRYCDEIITAPSGGATVTQKRVQCKKNLLPAGIDLDDDGQPDGEIVLGEWNLMEDGFCDAFSHANTFCRDLCYEGGGNGEITDNVCGYVDPVTGLKLQFGEQTGDCDAETALCFCDNGFGQAVPCISLCGNGPGASGETGLQCDDGNVYDGDCCAANCQFEAVGVAGACEADGNGCTTGGTCNASHQCIETCNVGALCAPAGCGLVCELDGGNCVCQ